MCLKRFLDMLLLLERRVEHNPVLISKVEAAFLENMDAIVSQIHTGHSSIMIPFKEVYYEQQRTNDILPALSVRVGNIESGLVLCKL